MNRRLYALHRWISLLTFVQLVAWTVSGSFFVLVPIERVRGTGVPGAHEAMFDEHLATIAPASALAVAGADGMRGATQVELRPGREGALYYVVRAGEKTLRLDARTGARAPVEKAEAEATARRDQPGSPEIVSVERVEELRTEYRGKPLPAWRVLLGDDKGTAVYVDATTGEVTARRNDLWRTYDWLWSLHIMDYKERESFNHPLIMAAALLAVATVLSGATLWVMRFARRVRKVSKAGSSATV